VLHCRAGASTTIMAFLHAASEGWMEAVKFFLEEMKVDANFSNEAEVRPSFHRYQNLESLTFTVLRVASRQNLIRPCL
jgi:DNA-binding MltR family transcriptional regulator